MKERDEILNSGTLEQYLLGELDPIEEARTEKLLQQDAELKEHYEKLEADFERLAMENAIEPPEFIRDEIMQTVEGGGPTDVRPLKQNLRNTYFAAAASLAAIFMLTSGWLFSKWSGVKNDIEVVEQQNEDLQNDLQELRNIFNETDAMFAAINDPDVIKVVLVGNEKSPDSKAISYLNHEKRTVLLNAEGLAKLPEDKDYQMWADVNGDMIDMGVIPRDGKMIAMDYIENAESLNITIEPAGGNDHPTVEELIANVYLEETSAP